MANDALTLRITAQTDELVKKIQDAQTKVRSLAAQMSEIDKQLKTESVDRVQKLSEKLELAKRASEMAAKEAELYAEKIKKMTDKHEDASKMTDREKERLLKLSEQMATAQQKANTYAAEVDKLSKELNEEASASDKAATETEEMGDAVEAVGKSASNASGGLKEFGRSVLADLASAAIQKGISTVINLWKNLASAVWNAAKNMATAMKNYAVEAVDLAADYADALGYSEQVFTDQADAVQKWVRDNSVALRINKSDLQSYVNSMGSLYRSFGMTAKDAAKYSEGLVTLATDLRAATGNDTKQIIESLTSVMTGGYKSGYKYGIVINEAAIKAKALAMGLADVEVNEYEVEKARISLEKATKKASEATLKYGENSLEAQEAQLAVEAATAAFEEALGGQTLALTQAQKEAAIYALTMEQTAHLQGQGARESGNYKSQLDALKTTFDNLKISIGEKLLPVFNGFVTEFNKFIESEEGKAFLDGIVESVENISKKVLEFIEDGTLEEWFNNAKEKIPDITNKIIQASEKVGELIPKIFDLTEKLLALFGIKSEAQSAKDAFMQVSNQVEEMAKTYNLSLETAETAINEFAITNGLKVSEVYENWEDYEPRIVAFIGGIAEGTENMEEKYNEHVSQLAPELQQAVTDISAVDLTPYDQHLAKMNQTAQDNAKGFVNAWNWAKEQFQGLISWFDDNKPRVISEGEDWRDQLDWSWRSEATGGPVQAGQMYRVNDDHGRRIEAFIPSVDGYVLNGNTTQSIINNNQRTSGDLNVYVNSYGADAASIADEIGTAVNQKLRMSGAML